MGLNRTEAKIWIFSFVVRIALLGIVLFYFGERALVLGDTERYLSLARNMLAGEGFRVYDSVLETYRPPGYPAYLLLFEGVGAPLWSASLIQILFASIIPVLAFRLSDLFSFPNKVGKYAAIFTALEPTMVFYSAVLLPDVLSSLLLILGILFFALYFLEGRNISKLALAAILLSSANYFRPAFLYFPPLLLLFSLFVFWKEKKNLREVLKPIMIFSAAAFLVLSPWSLRNYLAFGSFNFVSAGAVNFYQYGAAATYALERGIPYQKAREFLRARALGTRENFTLQDGGYLLRSSLEIIQSNPLGYLKTYLLGINTFFFSGNYHYLLLKYGVLSRPQNIPSFSLLVVGQGFKEAFEFLKGTIRHPYFFTAAFGKTLWLLIGVMSFAGGIAAYRAGGRQKFFAILFFLLVFYSALTILPNTIGVEARHRYYLNPFIFVSLCVFLKRFQYIWKSRYIVHEKGHYKIL